MKKSYNVRITSMLLYAAVLFLSNYLAYFMAVMTAALFQPLAEVIPATLLAIFVFAVYILIGFAIPFITIYVFFKFTVEKQYIPSDDKKCWVKSCVRLIIPAEIIRFLVCQITLGQINEAGAFAFLPTLLFESTYLFFTGRSEQVRQNFLQYNFADFAVYALCFLLYLAIHLVIIILIYRRFWLRAEKDRDDLIVHE